MAHINYKPNLNSRSFHKEEGKKKNCISYDEDGDTFYFSKYLKNKINIVNLKFIFLIYILFVLFYQKLNNSYYFSI